MEKDYSKEALLKMVRNKIDELNGDKQATRDYFLKAADNDSDLQLAFAVHGYAIAKALEESKTSIKH